MALLLLVSRTTTKAAARRLLISSSSRSNAIALRPPLPPLTAGVRPPPPRRQSITMATAGAAPETPDLLLLFDFDHTVCDGNTDTWILRALPLIDAETAAAANDAADAADAAQLVSPRHRLPPALHKCPPGGWTAYMQRIFDHAHEQGVEPSDLRRALRSIPLTPGFAELLAALERATAAATAAAAAAAAAGDGAAPPAVRAGVISDSNSLFIDWALEAHGLDASRLFAGAGVHTNPAAVDEAPPGSAAAGQGRARLVVAPHEPREGPGHGCPNCPPNLCKTKRLRAIVAETAARASSSLGAPPPRVAYVGDGGNDACPAAAALSSGDVVFARRGMALCKLLAGGKCATAATVVRWDSGAEILAWLRENWGVLEG